MTDMVIPPEAVEAIREAIWHVLDAIQDRDYYGQVSPNEDADTVTAAVVATLPHLRSLFETATKAETKLAEIANEMSTASPGQWADIRIPYVDVQIDKDTYRQLMAAREIGTKEDPMTEPPAWVYDLVIELMDQEELHPTLYFISGAFEGYAKYDWCACIALKKVPRDVVEKAAAIRAYKHNRETP